MFPESIPANPYPVTTNTSEAWSRSSWRAFRALQQPSWPDPVARDEALAELARLPALVFAGETRELRRQLAEASQGRAFVLQAGDCAEEFSRCHGPAIHDLLKVFLQMAVVLTYAGAKNVVKIGRLAGQYAKPRTSETEQVAGTALQSYRGDMVNSAVASAAARRPDPRRMLEGYFRSTATLNLVRAFTGGGMASLEHVHSWSEASRRAFPPNAKYDELVRGIRKTIDFIGAIGIDAKAPQLTQTAVYTSHEALLLEYEEAMTRIDTTTDRWYDTSAHMLWIGDRTRQPDGAHVEFLRGVGNPVGVKIGPTFNLDDVKRVIEILNPQNDPGRLALVTRFGSDRVSECLPPLLTAIKREGFHVVWMCDPMHGNTFARPGGRKTRRYEDILEEVRTYMTCHRQEGTVAGGVHLELTGDPVTECVGGSQRLVESDLETNYQTSCDPRLNAEQAVELAFEIAQIVNC